MSMQFSQLTLNVVFCHPCTVRETRFFWISPSQANPSPWISCPDTVAGPCAAIPPFPDSPIHADYSTLNPSLVSCSDLVRPHRS